MAKQTLIRPFFCESLMCELVLNVNILVDCVASQIPASEAAFRHLIHIVVMSLATAEAYSTTL